MTPYHDRIQAGYYEPKKPKPSPPKTTTETPTSSSRAPDKKPEAGK
jgi:hypothetical protein